MRAYPRSSSLRFPFACELPVDDDVDDDVMRMVVLGGGDGAGC